MIMNLQNEILRVKDIIARLKEEDWRSDSEHRVEDAVDDDEEVENRRRRRRRIGARASGRVAAGIGSSLEIAVGWLPHRLGRFIRGFLGGRSGERATRRRLETGPEEDRLILGNRAIVFPFHALRPIYNLRERVVVRERERKRELEESRKDPGETNNNVTLKIQRHGIQFASEYYIQKKERIFVGVIPYHYRWNDNSTRSNRKCCTLKEQARTCDASLTTAASFLTRCVGPVEKFGNHCNRGETGETGYMTEVDGIPGSLPAAKVYTPPFRALPRYTSFRLRAVSFSFCSHRLACVRAIFLTCSLHCVMHARDVFCRRISCFSE